METIIDLQSDAYFMSEALRMAMRAYEAEEVPIGAVVVRAGKIIARAFNQVEVLKDATAHAEMLALTQAEAALGDWRLNECDLFVTKEPCPMCAGALVHVRMRQTLIQRSAQHTQRGIQIEHQLERTYLADAGTHEDVRQRGRQCARRH